MRLFFLLTLLNAFLFTSLFSDIKNGKEMYDEADCKRCHDDYLYGVDHRKLKSLDELDVRVKRCAVSYAGWFEEDTQDVLEYLNKKFYKFEDKK